MKRHEFLRHLRDHGCTLLREGSSHSPWVNRADRRTTAVPRHTEIGNNMARKICRDLGIPSPSQGGGPD